VRHAPPSYPMGGRAGEREIAGRSAAIATARRVVTAAPLDARPLRPAPLGPGLALAFDPRPGPRPIRPLDARAAVGAVDARALGRPVDALHARGRLAALDGRASRPVAPIDPRARCPIAPRPHGAIAAVDPRPRGAI